MAAPGSAGPQTRPEVGDILLVIHDFNARSADELNLAKGDRVELIERDDEFGDGWFMGKHLVNGTSGLFPEVYTRPAPKGVGAPGLASAPPTSMGTPFSSSSADGLASAEKSTSISLSTPPVAPPLSNADVNAASTTAVTSSLETNPVTLPLSSFKATGAATAPVPSAPFSNTTAPPHASTGSIGRLNAGSDSHVLHETLNVIDEHITDLRSPPTNGSSLNVTDSGSEYSSHRLSYIQGEETDEEEDRDHSRSEVEVWSADEVAEYLFTAGVEKHHCEVFRDQDITGEVLLGMDQTSIFIKAFDLGSVGRRLKTWQKIKNLQDEVTGQGTATRRNTLTHGSEAGSDEARKSGRTRSRTNTLTNSVAKLDRPISIHSKRLSVPQTPKSDVTQTNSPSSPKAAQDGSGRPVHHEKRPSAASVRDLHHSRRHSSTDFRISGVGGTPRLMPSGSFPISETGAHKKQPSFDRNWTLGSASTYNRPISSAGFPDDPAGDAELFKPPTNELDRGYFSGTDLEGRKRNVLKKRDSAQAHSRGNSYAEEQRVRSATALSRHSRIGSIGSPLPGAGATDAAQKSHGGSSTPHRRTASTKTTESIRPELPPKDYPSPTVTKLDGSNTTPDSPMSFLSRAGMQGSKSGFKTGGIGLGLRAISDAVTGHERAKIGSAGNGSVKNSPLQSPTRTGSTTPSVGQSFEIDSQDSKSPNTAVAASKNGPKKKGKKETSAYQRGLLRITPRDAMADAEYSGWMKKRSSNLMTTWKPRLFVLKGRRLSYFYSEDDEQEKGLIDISFHRVLPADNERLTGLHATLTGASTTPTTPANSSVTTIAETQAEADVTHASESIFIFKLVPPRAGLSRAVNFTKPTVHYFAVPNIKQGRLWMAALMKATIDRDDTTPITTTYQQKTISLTKAQQMRHRPPALMNLEEAAEEMAASGDTKDDAAKKESNGLGIVYNENDSGISGMDKLGLTKADSASVRLQQFPFESENAEKHPLSA